jgi:hypothetical protein
METGCSLTILAWSNKLSDWLAGDPVEVPWKGKRRTIDDCTYGELARWLCLLVEQARRSQTDPELSTMIEDLNRVHEWFRSTLDTNKYIHKSRDVIRFTQRLLAHFGDDLLHGGKNEAVRDGLLDVRFEFHAELDRCLYGQATSRFIELCRQIELQGVRLPQSERDGFKALAAELIAAGERFEEVLRPHWAAWFGRHGEKVI